MVDSSWNLGGAAGGRRDAATRADERAGSSEARAAERAEAMSARLESRAATRAAQAQEREAARRTRSDAAAALAERDPHRAAAERKRGSGRRDVVRQDRDVSGYATLVDGERIRTLAARGASVAGLAAVFGLSEDEIARVLVANTEVA
ncbi:hypothetical protein [Sphingomonas phyllosphaerae]|uniref:hypothetical protein n=1 Tax=Sphingomonas phyllosphaerae TaxID=257003 RepID=UPI0024135846|nr:hypothetical protein [Sphingomonas phyllosphaerae]